MKSYAHQERIVDEAVHDLLDYGYHAIFAEVGTGKSKMLIDTAERLSEAHIKGLIISGPKSLAGTWREQVALHCEIPGYAFATFDCSAAKTKKWQADYDLVLASSFPILFVNTEAFQTSPLILRQTLGKFPKRFLLAIDESSDIKGPKAKRALNLTKFGQSAWGRIIMTGTEITNSILDLYQQFEFLRPGFWGFKNFFFFKNYYAILEERYISGGRTFKEIMGFRKLDELQARINPHVSRARKKDCLDLPPKIYATMPVQLEGECRRVYDELKTNLISMLQSGELLTVANKVALFTKFRQITGGTLAGIGVLSPRPEKLSGFLSEAMDTGEQAIVWSCFTEEINLIEKTLLSSGFTVARFDGLCSTAQREDAITRFQSGAARFFVANPAAASQGLNLQNAHIQYWYSLPTQAKHYEQGEGRIHRSGQTEPCVYKKILAVGTVDERIAEILKDKTDVMSAFRDGNVADILEVV